MMSNLQERNNKRLQGLSEIQSSIEQLRQQIEALNAKFVEETKFANAQANLTKQWKEALSPLEDLLVSACSVYEDEEVLEDMLSDVESIVQKVKSNFSVHKEKENKFLDEAKKVDVEIQQPLLFVPDIVEINEDNLPEPNDDKTLLNAQQIKQIIKLHNLEVNDVKKLAIMLEFEIPRSIKSFAEQGDNLLNRAILEQQILLIKPKTYLASVA